MIKSKKHFVKYVFTKLGHPIIEVELEQNQIKLIIDDIVDDYKFYKCCNLTEIEIYNVPIVKGMVVATCKKLWGDILSKYSISNDLQVNHESIKNSGWKDWEFWITKLINN